MAVTAGTGGTGTVDTTGAYIFQATGARETGCTSIQVWNDATSAGILFVKVDGLHDAGAPLPLAIGKSTVLRFGDMGIRNVFCSSASTSTLYWGVVARTGASL